MRTLPDGSSTGLAKDVTRRGVYAYSAARHLLGYGCDPASVCVVNVLDGRHYVVGHEPGGVQIDGVDFSPDGVSIASISQTGELRVFDISDLDHPRRRTHVSTGNGVALLYVSSEAIAVGVDGSVKVVHLNGNIQEYRDPDGSHWDVDTKQGRLALATTRGEGLVAETHELRIVARAMLCRDHINGLKFLPSQNTIAFICGEGTIGTWDLTTGKTLSRAHVDNRAHMIEVSEQGDYLLASGDSGVLTVADLITGVVTSFRGHNVRLVAMAAPTQEFPFFLSGDVRGHIRSWPAPARAVAVAARSDGRLRSAVFAPAADAVIALPLAPKLAVYAPGHSLRFVRPHDENAVSVALAEDGRHFVAYGTSGVVEIWDASTITRERTIDTHHGSVTHCAFVIGTSELITSGRDGRLVRWSRDGDPTTMAAFHDPILAFVLIVQTGDAVVATADGALWRVSADRRVLQLRSGGPQVTALRVSPDSRTIWVGDASGTVSAIDPAVWRHAAVLRMQSAIRQLAFTSEGRYVAVADSGDAVALGARSGSVWTMETIAWTHLVARARDLAFAPDGLLVITCAGGAVWMLSPLVKKWLYLPVGSVDFTHVVLNRSGTIAVAFDDEGRLFTMDLQKSRAIAE
jgi:WD40 repeat protein